MVFSDSPFFCRLSFLFPLNAIKSEHHWSPAGLVQSKQQKVQEKTEDLAEPIDLAGQTVVRRSFGAAEHKSDQLVCAGRPAQRLDTTKNRWDAGQWPDGLRHEKREQIRYIPSFFGRLGMELMSRFSAEIVKGEITEKHGLFSCYALKKRWKREWTGKVGIQGLIEFFDIFRKEKEVFSSDIKKKFPKKFFFIFWN